jgi:hypothetical protein
MQLTLSLSALTLQTRRLDGSCTIVFEAVAGAGVTGRWIVCKKLSLRAPAWSRAITITA